MQHPKLTFIGSGNMAWAIIQGLLKSGYPAKQIIACNKSNLARRSELQAVGIATQFTNREAVEQADVVILAVKPQMMADVCAEFSDVDFSQKNVISVAAGISVARLEQLLPTAKNIIRTMPNTPALIGEGLTGLFAKPNVNSTACEFAEQLMSAVGKCYWVDEEAKINQIIALTGSSPAYFFRFMEAMQHSAEQMGFSAEDARFLVQQAVFGAAKLVQASPNIPLSQLRENVTSKGGTTAKALEVFEQKGLTEIIEQAMQAAILRAREMEQSL
nr:pyrroline-5-carboxylate reductase [uncultured Haemophilus sp.]